MNILTNSFRFFIQQIYLEFSFYVTRTWAARNILICSKVNLTPLVCLSYLELALVITRMVKLTFECFFFLHSPRPDNPFDILYTFAYVAKQWTMNFYNREALTIWKIRAKYLFAPRFEVCTLPYLLGTLKTIKNNHKRKT